jgi:hypothetical protein
LQDIELGIVSQRVRQPFCNRAAGCTAHPRSAADHFLRLPQCNIPVWFWQDFVAKVFCTRDQNFFWLYTRLSCKMWGTSSPEDKLAGDLGNVIEATSTGGRRSDFFTAEKLAPGKFGTFATKSAKQQTLSTTRSPTQAAFSTSASRRKQHFLNFFPLPHEQGSFRPTPLKGLMAGVGSLCALKQRRSFSS